MTEQQIKEGNKIISEFMNMELSDKQIQFDTRIYYKTPFLPVIYAACEEQFAFHDDWSWIVPVIIKIEQIEFEEYEDEGDDFASDWTNKCSLRTFSSNVGVRFNRFGLHQEDTLLLSAFAAVVEVCKCELLKR